MAVTIRHMALLSTLGAGRSAPFSTQGYITMHKPSQATRTLYFTALGLLSMVFLISIGLSVFDAAGTIAEYRRLSFPEWLLIPKTTANALGLLALFQTRSQRLKDFAFAGFLYNLLLALGAHIAQQEVAVILPIVGLGAWVFAFIMDRRYHSRRVAARGLGA